MEATFNKLASDWLAATAIHSNPAIIARHPAYSQIVEMKEAAIPLILNEISQKRNRPHWFQVLNDITGMTPAPEEIGERWSRSLPPGWNGDRNRGIARRCNCGTSKTRILA